MFHEVSLVAPRRQAVGTAGATGQWGAWTPPSGDTADGGAQHLLGPSKKLRSCREGQVQGSCPQPGEAGEQTRPEDRRSGQGQRVRAESGSKCKWRGSEQAWKRSVRNCPDCDRPNRPRVSLPATTSLLASVSWFRGGCWPSESTQPRPFPSKTPWSAIQ